MMMAVGLAIGGDMHQLRPAAIVGKSAEQPVGKRLAIAQQPFEGHRARDGAVVEKQVDAAPRRQIANVGTRRVDLAAFHILELRGSDAPLVLGLRWRQHGELDVVLGQHFQRLHIDRGFRQPHAFGLAAEAVLEIANAPHHLRLLVAPVGQRHDHVVVHLRDGVAVSRETLLALLVGGQDRLVGVGRVLFQPRQQRGTEIEADPRIVVDDAGDAIVGRSVCASWHSRRSTPP